VTPTILLPDLRSTVFLFAPETAIRLQPFSGSAWRGAFGHSLKRLVCAAGLRPCAGCPLMAECLFPRFFGTEGETEGPRPFILAPAPTPRRGWLAAGEALPVRLTLLPGAERAAPYATRALIEAAACGLTSQRVPFRLARMEAEDGAPFAPRSLACPPQPEAVRLRFATPLRLRLAGDLVTGATLVPRHLVSAAARRLHGLGFADFAGLGHAAREEAAALAFAERRLGWLETTRHSTRQAARMQLGGIVGEAVLDLGGTAHVWPLLWAGTVLHLGKGASMGFGRIEATPL
jgi:hypothetical protein